MSLWRGESEVFMEEVALETGHVLSLFLVTGEVEMCFFGAMGRSRGGNWTSPILNSCFRHWVQVP